MPDENNQRLENKKTSIKTILLVEDDSVIAELLIQMITQETHYQVFSVPDGLERVPTIMLSVNAPLQEIKRRKIMCMRKPFDMYKLLETIHKLLV